MKRTYRKFLPIGEKFGKLTLIEEIKDGKLKKGRFLCDCGNLVIKPTNAVFTLHTKSCGCLNSKTHGMSYTRFYKIYDGINGRLRPSHENYNSYGGRGIKNEWKDFQEFKDDMYESYLQHSKIHGEKETTIDRIDSNGNYCKKNCRWATHKEQSHNTKRSINYKGKNMMDYCRELGFNEHTMRSKIRAYRLKYNVTAQDAFIKFYKETYENRAS